MSGYHLSKSLRGFTYKYLPTSLSVEEYRQKYKRYYDSASGGEQVPLEVETADFLFESLVDCGSHNADLNVKKFDRLQNVFKWIIRSIAFGGLSFIMLKVGQGIISSTGGQTNGIGGC